MFLGEILLYSKICSLCFQTLWLWSR